MKVPAALLDTLTGAACALGADAVRIHTDEGGWTMRAMDLAHVMMATAVIPASEFGDYAPYTESEDGDFAVDPARIRTALKGKGPAPDITVSGGRFILKGGYMTTSVPLLSTEGTGSPRGRLPELSASVQLDGRDLAEVVKAQDRDVQALKLTLSETDGLSVSGQDDTGTGSRFDRPADDLAMVSGNAVASYPMRALKALVSVLVPADVLDISFDTDMPVVAEFRRGASVFTWTVAPWIGEER